MRKRRQLTSYMKDMRTVLGGITTPAEVRSTTNYMWMLAMSTKLTKLGVPESVAQQTAANMTISFPVNFHTEFPDEFNELVKLLCQSYYMLYVTLKEDFGDMADIVFVTRVREEGIIELVW